MTHFGFLSAILFVAILGTLGADYRSFYGWWGVETFWLLFGATVVVFVFAKKAAPSWQGPAVGVSRGVKFLVVCILGMGAAGVFRLIPKFFHEQTFWKDICANLPAGDREITPISIAIGMAFNRIALFVFGLAIFCFYFGAFVQARSRSIGI